MTLLELIKYADDNDILILELNYMTRTAHLSNGEVVDIIYPSEKQ